jgi:hypothetical protein
MRQIISVHLLSRCGRGSKNPAPCHGNEMTNNSNRTIRLFKTWAWNCVWDCILVTRHIWWTLIHSLVTHSTLTSDFRQWRLFNLTTHSGIKLKKHLSNFSSKYFPIQSLVFEKMCADVICSSLGLNVLNGLQGLGSSRHKSVPIQHHSS